MRLEEIGCRVEYEQVLNRFNTYGRTSFLCVGEVLTCIRKNFFRMSHDFTEELLPYEHLNFFFNNLVNIFKI